jgi:MFS transporter, DHA1 family, chloramphenicol/florfenicol resistance protein
MTARQLWTCSLPATLLLMAPFDVLASLGMDIYLPVVPQMPEALATTPAKVQLTLSLYLLTLGCGQLVFGPLSDRFGRRPVLLADALLFTLSSAVLALASSITSFVVARVAQAGGGAAALVATFATVRDVYAARSEGTIIYGLFSAIVSFVPAFGPLFGALLERGVGWRGIFLLLSLLGSLAYVQALWRWPETAVSTGGRVRLADLGDILTNAPFWVYTLGQSAAMGAFFVCFSIAPRLLINRNGLDPVSFSLVFATIALVMVAMSSFSRHFVAHFGVPGCLTRGMTLLLVGATIFWQGARSWLAACGLVLPRYGSLRWESRWPARLRPTGRCAASAMSPARRPRSIHVSRALWSSCGHSGGRMATGRYRLAIDRFLLGCGIANDWRGSSGIAVRRWRPAIRLRAFATPHVCAAL